MLNHARSDASAPLTFPFPLALDHDEQGAFHAPTGAPLAAAFDLLRVSLILTDGSGEVRFANRQARIMLKEQRCVRLCVGRLSAVNPKCALHLKQAIREAAAGKGPNRQTCGIPVSLSRSGQPPVAAWVLPVAEEPGGDPHQAAIFIRNTVDLFSEEMFGSAFGATLAELRVLKLMFSGLCIDEISRVLKLSRNTVRTHVKALLAKTGTSRQAELLRVACGFVAPASA